MKKNNTNLIIFFALFSIFFIMIYFNFFSNIEANLADRMYGGKAALDNIIIVKIDDESINKIGRWPWDRNVFSRILEKTKNAKAVGVDVSFFETSKNDSSLKKIIESSGNIVLAAEVSEKLYRPIFNSSQGYVNFDTDDDGITRKLRADLTEDAEPFSFVIYEKAIGNINAEEKEYLINFASGPGSFNSLSAYKLLEKNFSESFKDKIVLIGATAPNLHDNYFVPTSNGIAMAGVEIHANVLQNLILNNFLERQSQGSILISVLFFSIVSYFFLGRLKIYYIVPILIAIVGIYFYIAVLVFERSNIILDLFFVPLCIIVFTGVRIGANYLEEKKNSAYLTDAFGKYLSKDLVKEIIQRRQELKLGGDKRIISVFFSDIRGFTTISEKLTPHELVEIINEYLTEMTQVIMENRGTVDKFIGDAIMAFWNAPLNEKDHAYLSCKSAVEQIKKLRELRKKDKKFEKIDIGCGINTGEAIVGNMGSQDRFDYTALGDTVNLASRLESLTKKYGVGIIIAKNTRDAVKDKFGCRLLDRVKVKGKKSAVDIYELCVDYNKEFCENYEQALDLYFNKKFKEALREFEKLAKKDKSSELFVERCKEFLNNGPEKDWDGSYEMKEK